MVLLKGVSDDGFVFFTNTRSRKGDGAGGEPARARCCSRGTRSSGRSASTAWPTPLPQADVDAYFAVRPRGSQLGAWASHQSRVVAGRAELDRAYAEAEARFDGDDVPTPEEWGGYVVRPEAVEFWQGRPGRMHDRLVYRRDGDGWGTGRLAP